MDYSETNALEDDNTPLHSTKDDYKDLKKKSHNLAFYAKFNYDLLNLDRFDFFIECEDTNQLENVRKFCDTHPYTSYRTRIHGGKNGVYIIFFMPKDILGMLLFSLQSLKDNQLIQEFTRIFQTSNVNIFSLLRVDVFNASQNKWEFNFETSINKFSNEVTPNKLLDFFDVKKEQPILNKLNKIDIMILNEWGYGAGPRKTKAEILNNITNGKIYESYITDLKINRYIISDHIDYLLNENIIEYVGVGFDRRKIQIFTTLFYSGEAKKEFLNLFANYVKSTHFPFESRFSIGDTTGDYAKFTWWVSFTPNIVSEVTEYLFKNCTKLETFIIIMNTNDSETYALYHANFMPYGDVGGSWNNTEDHCLIEPLKIFFDEKSLSNLINKFHK